MIDDLLPLLNHRTSRQFIRRLPSSRRPRPFRLSLPTAIPLVLLGTAATVVIGCFFFTARPSMAGPILTSVASPAIPSSSVLEKKSRKKSSAPDRSSSGGRGALAVAGPAAETYTYSYLGVTKANRLVRQARRDQLLADGGHETLASR